MLQMMVGGQGPVLERRKGEKCWQWLSEVPAWLRHLLKAPGGGQERVMALTECLGLVVLLRKK